MWGDMAQEVRAVVWQSEGSRRVILKIVLTENSSWPANIAYKCVYTAILYRVTPFLKKFKNIVTHLGKTLYIKKHFEAQTLHHACAVLKSLLTAKSARPDRSLRYKHTRLLFKIS